MGVHTVNVIPITSVGTDSYSNGVVTNNYTYEDELAPARGILFGTLIGGLIYLLVLFLMLLIILM